MGEFAPAIAEKVVPPSEETIHCTLGIGEPEADAEKDASDPAVTEIADGCIEIEGATSEAGTVSVAARDVTLPAELLNTASKASADWDRCAMNEYVEEVAPEITAKAVVPARRRFQRTFGLGTPDADARNETTCPAVVATLVGSEVILGSAVRRATRLDVTLRR